MIKKYDVGGMTCSMCSKSVENAVNKLDKIESAHVSLMEKSLIIQCDDSLTDEDVFSAVRKAGYTIKVHTEKKDVNVDEIKLKKRFFVSLFFLLPLLYFAMGKMVGLPIFGKKTNLVIQAILSLVVIAINFKFYISGIRAVMLRSPNMDTLISIGSFFAYVYSFVVMIISLFGLSDNSHVFFESSAMILVLVTLGKWLEEISKGKTGREIEKLISILPDTITVLTGDKEKSVSVKDVKINDVVIIRSGEYIPIDGKVIFGSGSVDKSAITGESVPVEITEGDEVISGSILKNGYIKVLSEHVNEDTVFSRIIERVKNAGSTKAPVQRLADKISGIFVPVVCAISLITFIVWLIAVKDLYTAFKYAICVLVISCPCSLGLATPVAIMAGTGKSASLGVLFKDAKSMQNCAKINCVLLDKTATLTVGKPKVTGYVNYSDIKNDRIFEIISALENYSNHPLKDPIIDFCGKSDLMVENYEYVIGKGIIGEIDGIKYYLGNFKTVKPDNSFFGKSVITLSCKNDLLCSLAISDTVREDSPQVIKELKKSGIKPVMITGDNEESAKAIAEDCGLTDYVAEVLPEGKADIVKEYKKKGFLTSFVGDGINDTPALKSADIGMAIGTGTDVAIESADVVLSSGSLSGIIDAILLSKKTNGIIKGNLFWALFYNVLLIPVASGIFAFMGLSLTPTISSLCMSLSSLFVVLNALRINGYKKNNLTELNMENNTTIKIEGMMCKHCESRVFDVISNVSGVNKVEISLKKGIAKIDGDFDIDKVKKAVEDAGYKVL